MSKGKRRAYSREFKLSAVKRALAGESVEALSRHLGVPGGHVYKWCQRYRAGGEDALRPACRPSGRWGFCTRASNSWNSIFFAQPCGKSRGHAGRATDLARGRLRGHRVDDVTPAARRAHGRADV